MEHLILLAIAQEGTGTVPAETLAPDGQSQTSADGSNGNGAGTTDKTANPPRGFGLNEALMFVALAAVMYLLFIRGPRKQQRQQKEMVQSLKKNDRVRTIGGIIGTIVEVRDDYVTLKIDESSNTRIKVIPGAISKNMAPETKE